MKNLLRTTLAWPRMLLLLLVTLCMGTAGFGQQFIVNGSLTGTVGTLPPSGWTVNGSTNPSYIQDVNSVAWSSTPSSSPNGGTFFTCNGSSHQKYQAIAQAFSGLIVGKVYTLSFYWAKTAFSIYSGDCGTYVIMTGFSTTVPIYIQTAQTSTDWNWQLYTTTLTATATSGQIGLGITSTSFASISYDGVSLIGDPVCSAPSSPTISGANQSLCGTFPATTYTSGYSGGTGGVSYQWLLNCGVISGATGSSYTTPATTAAGNYAYSVQIIGTGTCNTTVTSPSVTTTVNALPSSALTATQPSCTNVLGSVAFASLPSAWSIARSGSSTATLTGSSASYTDGSLAAGTYSYVVTNTATGCVSASSATTMVVPAGSSSLPALLATATTKTLTLPACTDANGFLQFVDPSNTSVKYMAINPNGNTGYSFTGTAFNNSPTVANQQKTNGFTNTTALANRMYTITDAGTNAYTTNGGMAVRIYYTAADSTSARANLDPAVLVGSYSGSWFKLAGTVASVLAAQTATGITGAVFPAAKYGTENGTSYVELSGITSFSTFGFAEKKGTTILPVTISSLTATMAGCSANIAWATAIEQNSATYQVETSTDGKNFAKVGEVKSQNSATGASYTFTDNSLAMGTNYFRLKAIDLDAQYTYSQIVAVTSSCLGSSSVTVSPNPTSNMLNVQGLSTGSTLSIYGVNGQKMTSLIATGSNQAINIGMYAKGIYILRVSATDGTVSNIKVIKD